MDNIYDKLLETVVNYKWQNIDVLTDEEIKDLNFQIETIKEEAIENEISIGL